MQGTRAALGGWLALALALPLLSFAYTIEPELATLRSAGSGSSAFFRLQNRQHKPAAVELTVHEHRKDVEGKPVAGPSAEDSFLIYPQQVVMLPGDEVAVQVRWIGDPALPAERAYSIMAREVAIPPATPRAPAAGGVRIEVTVLVNYEARLYVAPPGSVPQVLVESVEEVPAAIGAGSTGPHLRVMLANRGTAHEELHKLSFVLMPVDSADRPLPQQSVRVAARDVAGTRPHLLAGDRRRIHLPRPGAFPAGRVHVRLAP